MVDRTLNKAMVLWLVAGAGSMGCNSDPGTTTASTSDSTSESSTGTTGGPTSETPTTSDGTSAGTGSVGETSAETTDSPSTGNMTSVSSTTDMTGMTGETGETGDTGETGGTGTTGGVSATEGETTTGGVMTTDETTSSDETTGDTNGCVPSEDVEVTCDKIDNDCDGQIDDVDVGNDGLCDCLNIGILGNTGYAPNADFEAWIMAQGSSVTRTLLLNNPGVVTPAFLANYDLVLVDRIERQLSPAEATAIEDFVKKDGNGLITLIGYNFDNLNPVPEVGRANSVLTPFGLAYQGGYFGDSETPILDQNHPVSMGIVDIHFAGGVKPADTGNQGQSDIFATVLGTDAGLAHQTAMNGGRVIVWGDEWLTFDSDWQGYADVEQFWVQMVAWAKAKDFCAAPQ